MPVTAVLNERIALKQVVTESREYIILWSILHATTVVSYILRLATPVRFIVALCDKLLFMLERLVLIAQMPLWLEQEHNDAHSVCKCCFPGLR